MSHLFNIKSVVLIALIILLFGLMVGQMIHVLLVATRKENRNPRGAVAYEALLLAHLLLACATVCSALRKPWHAAVPHEDDLIPHRANDVG